MIEANSSWPRQQFSVRESPNNCMFGSVEARRHEPLSAQLDANPYGFSANCGLNGYGTSVFPESGPTYETRGLLGNSILRQTPPISENPHAIDRNALFSSGNVRKPSPYTPFNSQQKRFLIFDHSGNETRFLFSSPCAPAGGPISAGIALTCPFKSAAEGHCAEMEQRIVGTPLHEEFGENDIAVEEDDFHEDTEEMNALLYSEDDSDSFDHYDRDHIENNVKDEDCDEVNSTGHSPSTVNWNQMKQELSGYVMEEGVRARISRKRRKVLGDGCAKVSLTDFRSLDGLDGDNAGVYCSCAIDEVSSPVTGSKRSRRDKIHDTLRALESIIPGAKNKDPMVVLDEAISYLKHLKSKPELYIQKTQKVPAVADRFIERKSGGMVRMGEN